MMRQTITSPRSSKASDISRRTAEVRVLLKVHSLNVLEKAKMCAHMA